MRHLALSCIVVAGSSFPVSFASPEGPLPEPTQSAAGIEYPFGAALPRHATDAERRFLEHNPQDPLRGSTPPSDYTNIRAVAEYEPMDAIVFAWQGASSWLNIVVQMINHITRSGDADAVVYVESTAWVATVTNQIAAGGADMSRVRIVARNLDSIWVRDYGPRYMYEGDVRSVVDHTYNVPRPNDNALNPFHAAQFGHSYYELPLRHGGGNYHLDALGVGYATRLIVNENQQFSEQEIIDLWQDYQGVETRMFTPLPNNIDATQHIDMWMQVVADDTVIISDWPTQSGSIQDQICDAAAVEMDSLGFTVFRVPAVSINTGGFFNTHYTFTNMVMCNDIVLLPSYTNGIVNGNGWNQQALATLQSALPDKTIIQIPCEAIVSAAGVMHCIVMHMPRHVGGENPTALVRFPNGGEAFEPGAEVEIRWSTDDREGVANVDILLSTDNGASFNTVIASATADDGSFLWTVPDVGSSNALIRVVARGDDSDTGFDDSDAVFAILGECPGDTNGDGIVNFTDLNAVLGAFGQTGAGIPADVNGDGVVNFSDLNQVLAAFGVDCN
jgi:agmatine/peptidylarginine deiminase